MTYLIWQQENGNFVGTSSEYITYSNNNTHVFEPSIADFHWDKDVESVVNFIWKYLSNEITEVKLVDRETKSKTIKTFKRP